AVVPDLGIPARVLAVRARFLLGLIGLDEVRAAARRAALGVIPGRVREAAPEGRVRRRVRARDLGRVLDPAARFEPAPRRARLLRPHGQVPDRPELAVLDLGLEAIRRRVSRPPPLPARAPGHAGDRRGRGLLRAPPEDVAATRGAHRGPADRVRDRADSLVLPLPPAVLPVRRARRPFAGTRAVVARAPGPRC